MSAAPAGCAAGLALIDMALRVARANARDSMRREPYQGYRAELRAHVRSLRMSKARMMRIETKEG